LVSDFTGAGRFTWPKVTIFPAAFLARTGWTLNIGDWGAAFAVAEVFLGMTGSGLVSATGFAAIGGLAFALRSLVAVTLCATPDFRFAESACFSGTGSCALSATFRVLFAAVFFAVFTGFAFEIFAPVLARLRVVRAERGLAATAFFGFFMAIILATECGCSGRVRPVFRGRNGYLNFGLDAMRLVARPRNSQLIDAQNHPGFYLRITA
jgi:hypothetical protein